MPATSWKPEVKTPGDREWVGNGLRFATKDEAERNVRDLAMRWTAVTEYQAAESDDAVNYFYSENNVLIPIENVQREAAE